MPLPISSGDKEPRVEEGAAHEAFYVALGQDDPEQLYDLAPCGYLTTTPEGLIVKVNQTFLLLTGYERTDLVGKRRFADLLTAGGRIYHETHYAPMLQLHGVAREIALELIRPDGRRIPVLVNSVLERDEADIPVVVRTAIFDATQRRQYERELLKAKQRAEESEAHAKELARTLQQTLIPPALPKIQSLDVAAQFQPAGEGGEIGGDFYDVFEIGDGDCCAVVGDVCGKGVDAAVVTALARYTVRAASVRHEQPSEALHTLNEVLLHHETTRFCTVAVLRLRRDGELWRATLSLGGHPLPLLARNDGPTAEVGRPGTLIGIFDRPRFTDVSFDLMPGDFLVLYTDGITEAMNREGALYGEDRLTTTIASRHGPAASVVNGVFADVSEFLGGVRYNDDAAVVVLAVPPTTGASSSPGAQSRA